MNVLKILDELKSERAQIEEALASLEKERRNPPFSPPSPASAAATAGPCPYTRKRVDSTSYYPSSNARRADM